MKSLDENWLINGLIDFEYKKYQLLAFLKASESSFHKNKLYPPMADLIFHYNNMLSFKRSRDEIQAQFPKRIASANLTTQSINYHDLLKDDKTMAALIRIITYAEPRFKDLIEEGKELYELVEEQMEISTIGISSLYTDEGYFLIHQDEINAIDVYRYKLTVYTHSSGNHRGIHARHIVTETKKKSESIKSLKLRIARRDKELDNPATYLINTRYSFPVNETLLPISKRKLVQYIHQNVA